MTIDKENLLESILSSIDRIDYIHPTDIPGIDLYMDQVTTFMEEQLLSTKRYQEDKILTKTMINNYAKNNLLPPPEKKKYTKEHLLILTFIYYFKNILSIKDIERLLNPISEKFFSGEDTMDITRIYQDVCQMEKERIHHLKDEITEMYTSASSSFADAPESEQEFLKQFMFICHLSFDVYVKKLLIEKLVDELPDPTDVKNKKKTKKG